MRLIEIISEARRHPEMNARISGDEQLAAIAQEHGTDDIYVTFTTVNKFGVNVSTKYNTPTGIYSFPISYVLDTGVNNVPLVSKNPYIYVFKNNTPRENTWNISMPVDNVSKRMIDVLTPKVAVEPSLHQFSTNRKIWEKMYKYVMGADFDDYDSENDPDSTTDRTKPSLYAPKARNLLMDADIFAVIDNGSGIIYPDEPTQALFLNIKYLEVLGLIVNSKSNEQSPGKSQHEYTDLICKDPLASLRYAIHTGRRFRKGEKAIVSDPRRSVSYARDILKKRWPEAEPYIMNVPSSAYMYAKDVLKNRWPEAEPYIMKNPEYAYMYAKDVLKNRWPEAEPYIMSMPAAWRLYMNEFSVNKPLVRELTKRGIRL